MKSLIVLGVCALALAAARPEDSFYDTRYDNFNIDEITGNPRLLKSYAHCFLGEGKCTPDGTNFKKWIPEAVQTNCGKCTDKQKVLVAKAIKSIEAQLPLEWERLRKSHDQKDEHIEDLKAFIAQYAP